MLNNELQHTVDAEKTNGAPNLPVRNKGGAPIGNSNRTKSGKRAWSAVKRLPKGSGAIRQQLYCERDEIEIATGRQHGEVSLFHAALIQSAIRHSGRAQLLERWLRVEPDLTLNERLAVLKEIGAATDSRDKCLQRLGLDVTRELTPLQALAALPALGASTGVLGPHDGDHHAQQETKGREVLPHSGRDATAAGSPEVAQREVQSEAPEVTNG